MSFESDINRFINKVEKGKSKFVKKVTVRGWQLLTEKTPVDTGRAKSNWFANEGAPSSRVEPDRATPDPGAVLAVNVSGAKDVYITNNLPYIERLEHGHSKQAPAGMLRVSRNQLAREIENGKIKP